MPAGSRRSTSRTSRRREQCLDEDGWADPGHGVLDWSTLVPVLQGDRRDAVRGRARQAERCRTVRASRLRHRRRPGAKGAIDEGSWRRHRRLRRYFDHLHAEPRVVSRRAAGRVCGYSGRAARESRPSKFGIRALVDRRVAARSRGGYGGQSDHAQRAFRGQPCGADRGQACVLGKAALRQRRKTGIGWCRRRTGAG